MSDQATLVPLGQEEAREALTLPCQGGSFFNPVHYQGEFYPWEDLFEWAAGPEPMPDVICDLFKISPDTPWNRFMEAWNAPVEKIQVGPIHGWITVFPYSWKDGVPRRTRFDGRHFLPTDEPNINDLFLSQEKDGEHDSSSYPKEVVVISRAEYERLVALEAAS